MSTSLPDLSVDTVALDDAAPLDDEATATFADRDVSIDLARLLLQ